MVKDGNIHAIWHQFYNNPYQSSRSSTTVLSKVAIELLTPYATMAMIGPNAAGKSTLVKRIAGLISGPGAVQLSDATRGDRAICYMPQDTGSNAVLTVYESLLLAAKQGGSWRVQNRRTVRDRRDPEGATH